MALVPSSDWRGIDPEHGLVALMNAVAVGLPMVRPVRAATSIANDQYGRLLYSLRADASGDGVMLAAMPAERVPTLYAKTGEILPLLALALGVCIVIRAVRSPPPSANRQIGVTGLIPAAGRSAAACGGPPASSRRPGWRITAGIVAQACTRPLAGCVRRRAGLVP